MAYPCFLYLNRATAGTITASATTSGYPATNLSDWRDYLRWHGSGATNSYTVKIDCGSSMTAAALALSGHNLYTCGARYKLDGSDNDADWTAVVAYQTPGHNRTVAHFFTSASYRYWRLTIDNNGGANFTPQLGVYFVGNYIEMEDYIDGSFDPDAATAHGSQDVGETGRLLGVSTDWVERSVTLTFNYITKTWFTSTWQPFWQSYFDQPVIFAWDRTNYAAEAYLMRWNVKTMTAPYVGGSDYRGPLVLSLTGVCEW